MTLHENRLTVFDLDGEGKYKRSALLQTQLNHILVPSHQFYYHDLHLGKGQMFAEAASRARAKYHRHQIFMFLVFFLLPSLRNKFFGVFKSLRIVEHIQPGKINVRRFFNCNSVNSHILNRLSLEC